jgi:hypothetical protein
MPLRPSPSEQTLGPEHSGKRDRHAAAPGCQGLRRHSDECGGVRERVRSLLAARGPAIWHDVGIVQRAVPRAQVGEGRPAK